MGSPAADGNFSHFRVQISTDMSLVINTLQVTGNENSTGQLCYPVKDAILLASAPHKFDFMCETYRQEQATG